MISLDGSRQVEEQRDRDDTSTRATDLRYWITTSIVLLMKYLKV